MVGLGTFFAAVLVGAGTPSQHAVPVPENASHAIAPDPIPAAESNESDIEFSRFGRMLARDLDGIASMRFMVEQWSLWTLECDRSPALSVLDDLFALPAEACHGIVSLARSCFSTSGCYSLRQENEGPLIGRLGILAGGSRMTSPFTEFARQWVARQHKVMGEDSYLRTMSYELGFEAVDEDALWSEEQKLIWDVARKVYLSRYFGRSDERVREMWRFSEWRSVDYIVAPPLLAAYTWYRGWERRITVWDTRLQVKLEPLSTIVHNAGRGGVDVPFALAVEWEIPGFPIRAIVAAGLRDGGASVDFIGIGTSIAAARKAYREVSGD